MVRIDCGSQTIRYEVRPPIAEVVLDRPAHGNTFTPELLAELADATGRLATDAGIRAVILRGEGRNFCFGADVFIGAGSEKAVPVGATTVGS